VSEQDYLMCRVPREIVESFREWTEVAAIRFVELDEDNVEFVITKDLERVTEPGASA
jgi:hypothetical protein